MANQCHFVDVDLDAALVADGYTFRGQTHGWFAEYRKTDLAVFVHRDGTMRVGKSIGNSQPCATMFRAKLQFRFDETQRELREQREIDRVEQISQREAAEQYERSAAALAKFMGTGE